MSDKAGVYSITSPSGSKYIGITADSFANRWRGHVSELRRGVHKCKGLQRAFIKYGEAKLAFTVLEEIGPDGDFLAREIWWWEKFHSSGVKLYNGRPTGTGSVFHTAETRLAISEGLRKAKRLSEDDLIRLQMLVGEATTEAEVRELTGLTVRSLRRRGVIVSLPPRRSNPLKELDRQEIHHLYYTLELTCEEIAARFGVAQQTAYRTLKAKGIKFRRRGSRKSHSSHSSITP